MPTIESTQTVTHGPFFKGVDYSVPADEIDYNTLYEMENFTINSAGHAFKRNGSTPINGTALNSGASVTAIGNQRFSAASSKTFAIIGNKFYEDIMGTPTDRTSTATITAGDDLTWELVNADGTLIGHNGDSGDTIIKWPASGNIAALDVDSRFTTAKHVEWFDRRAFWGNLSSGVNRVWYSDTDDIETYGALNFFTFDTDVTGIKKWVNGSGCVIHTENSLIMLSPTGDASVPYRKNLISTGDDVLGGSLSGRCIINVPGFGQVFPRRDGIYSFNGQERIAKISYRLDGSRFWDNINADRLAYSFAQIYPNRNEVWFWLPYGSGQVKMNIVMVLNYRLSQRVGEPVWYGPYVDLTRNCAALISDKPHFGGFDGFVYKHDIGTVDDDGTTDNAIDGYIVSGSSAPFGGKVDCDWISARTFFEISGNHDIEMTEISPDIPSDTQLIHMGGSYDAIGVDFAIGVSAIAGDSEVQYSDKKLSGKSPFKQLKYRNGNASQPCTIRKTVLAFDPIGTVYRDVSGAN